MCDIILPWRLASHYIFDIIFQVDVDALIFPVIPREDNNIYETKVVLHGTGTVF